MKAVSIGILAILTLLAVSSGITKILLMPQDVNFFGKYGFSDPILIAFGSVQLLGGLLLVFTKTRFAGGCDRCSDIPVFAGLAVNGRERTRQHRDCGRHSVAGCRNEAELAARRAIV